MGRRKKFDPEDHARYTPAPVELPQDAASAVPEIRRFAAMVWNEVTMLFGSPLDLVHLMALSVADMRLARDWVRNLELLVRRMVLIVALSMKLAPARPWPPCKAEPRARCHSWIAPDTWKVAFRMTPRASQAGLARTRTPPPRKRYLIRTIGLARRIEAVRRAIIWHRAAAQRFARTLARRQAAEAGRNDRTKFVVRGWDFHPYRDTKGMFAINDAMRLAVPLAQRELARWQGLIEPG